jgi:hypothetical protein
VAVAEAASRLPLISGFIRHNLLSADKCATCKKRLVRNLSHALEARLSGNGNTAGDAGFREKIRWTQEELSHGKINVIKFVSLDGLYSPQIGPAGDMNEILKAS